MRTVGKNFKTIAILIFSAAVLDMIFHRPPNINQILKEQTIPESRSKPIEIPELISLKEYLQAASQKQIFIYKKQEKKTTSAPINWGDFQINGVVYLDKPYVAVLWKSRREQYLVPEGASLGGLTVRKIEKIKSGKYIYKLILQSYGEERVEYF